VLLTGFWLVVLVLAVVDDDGSRIVVAALWPVSPGVRLARILRSRRKARREAAQHPSP
jgi:hypothetical protein